MKVAICSDLHLEFGTLHLTNEENADVLILGGDILLAADMKKAVVDDYVSFIKQCTQEFKHVIYVMGNHEHYHGDFAETPSIIQSAFSHHSNFHFLNNEWIIINGVLFFGGTLWTDMNKEDPTTMIKIRYMMNDFSIIKNTSEEGKKVFMPVDAVDDHYEFLNKLDEVLALHPDLPTVVVGHHAPSAMSTHPRYKHELIMNGAYRSSLENFILDRKGIKLWTHGHTHDEFDYMIGTTRVVCNPRGYKNHEKRADDFVLKYVEI
jgi:DNA repair exonuclease SbcCD nuclease subunit